jgi:hypothetical protein
MECSGIIAATGSSGATPFASGFDDSLARPDRRRDNFSSMGYFLVDESELFHLRMRDASCGEHQHILFMRSHF